jgi:exonuclease VII small subunit
VRNLLTSPLLEASSREHDRHLEARVGTRPARQPRLRASVAPLTRALATAGGLLLLPGCAWLSGGLPLPSPAPTPYQRAMDLLERESYGAADTELRQIAASCENGEDGRRALVLLPTLWLEPRNAMAKPDSGAVLAARVLYLPDADPAERFLARTLYVLALELGADPYVRPALVDAPDALALRFSDCEAPVPRTPAPLPILGRESLTATVARLERERDALDARAAELGEGQRALQQRVEALQAQLQAAQAELQRVRRLLGGPDTASAGPP